MKKIYTKFMVLFVAVTMLIGIVGMNTTTVEAKTKATTDYTIKVNLGTNCTTIYDKKGKPIKAMICSPSSETPVGTFYVPVKYRWHEMIGNCYAQYCTRITGSVLFHSVWYYKNGDKSTMSVSAYNVMGNKASHGCVRLLCKDAKWIYDHCAVGTKVVIFWGKKKDDPIKRPSFTRISTGAFISWDPTDPDPKNPYNKVKPKITAKSTTIKWGKKVKNLDLVTIKDSAGNVLTKKNAKITVKGKINTKKLGKYRIKYTVKDSLGHKNTKTITFKVVDTKKPVISGAKSKKNVPMGTSVNVLNGVTAKAVSGKNLTSRIKVSVKYNNKSVKVSKGVVNFANAGSYKVTYTVKGTNKKTKTKTVTYSVTDQRVKFALKNSNITISEGDEFDPYDYVQYVNNYKNNGLNIKSSVKVQETVDTTKPGTYVITYTAQEGNKTYTARKATLKVTVKQAEETTTPEGSNTEPEGPTTESN